MKILSRSGLCLVVFLLGCLVLVGASGGLVWAAATGADTPPTVPSVTENGLTVAPYLQDLTLPKNSEPLETTIQITNTTAYPQSLEVTAVDLSTLNNSGGIPLLGANLANLQARYRLSPWLTVSPDTFTVAPAASQSVQITVRNDPAIPAGGHYGAILFHDLSARDAQKGVTTVEPIVTALLFVSKTDGAQYGLNLDSWDLPLVWDRLPASTTLLFRNTGTVHLVPRGVVQILDPFGREVGRGIVDQDSLFLFPGVSRTYPVSIRSLALPLVPGRYTVTASYRYDGKAGFVTVKQTFWLTPPIFLLFVAVLILVLLGFYFLFWYNWYKRRR
ncbi:hypothetical protein KGQ71_01075 [Patescibacteria group bacterium]|nr:hypothetical protein [Patescibacteria group bacterium]